MVQGQHCRTLGPRRTQFENLWGEERCQKSVFWMARPLTHWGPSGRPLLLFPQVFEPGGRPSSSAISWSSPGHWVLTGVKDFWEDVVAIQEISSMKKLTAHLLFWILLIAEPVGFRPPRTQEFLEGWPLNSLPPYGTANCSRGAGWRRLTHCPRSASRPELRAQLSSRRVVRREGSAARDLHSDPDSTSPRPTWTSH